MRIPFFLLFSLAALACANAQQTISGMVKDAQTKEILQGANIYLLPDKSIGTFTDSAGYFELQVPALPVKLEISYLGYDSKRVTWSAKTPSKQTIELIDFHKEVILPVAVVVKGTPIELFTPAPLMNITPLALRRDLDISIQPALNRLSGVYMQSGALNTNRITIRGIGSRSPFSTTKIRAYLDDIPLTTGDGTTTLEDIDLSLIDKVTVWKGPTASIYGAGLGGMIHLKTANQSASAPSQLSTSHTFGQWGLFRHLLSFQRFRAQEGGAFQFQASLNSTEQEGFRDNSDYDRKGLALLGKWSDDQQETTFFTNFLRLKAFIPSSLDRDDYLNNPNQAAFIWQEVQGFEDYDKLLLGIAHHRTIARWNTWRLNLRNSWFGTYRDAYELRPFNILTEQNHTIGWRGSLELREHTLKNIRFAPLSVGFEVLQEDYNWQTYEVLERQPGTQLSNNSERRMNLNLFAQSYLLLGQHWRLLTGVNVNQTTYDYQDRFNVDSLDLSGKYSFHWIASPRLGLTYELWEQGSLFTTISHGFSPPTLAETLQPSGAINPDIQPEQGWNLELGSRGALRQKWQYEISLYRMYIRDLLVARRTDFDQFVGVNAGQTVHDGLEVFVDYERYSRGLRFAPFFTYTLSDYRFTEFEESGENYAGNALTGTPRHQVRAGLDLEHDWGWYAHLTYEYTSAMPLRDDNSIFSEAFQVVHVKLGFEANVAGPWKLDLFLGIQNLFDEQYASMFLINASSFGGQAPRYYYPGRPRTIFGGLRLDYAF